MTQPTLSFWSYYRSKFKTDASMVAGAGSAALATLLFVIGLHEQWGLVTRAVLMSFGLSGALLILTVLAREAMRRSKGIVNDEQPRSALSLFAGMFAAALLASGLLAREPIQSGFAYREGKQLFDDGQFAAAKESFSRYIAIHPKLAAGYFWRGKAEFRAGQLDSAYADLKQAIKLQPRDWNSHVLLLGTLQKLGRDDELKQQLDETSQLNKELRSKWEKLVSEIAS